MDARERHAIEYGELRPRPHPDTMDEACVACGTRVGWHWARLHGDVIGWVGCTGALLIAQAQSAKGAA